MNRLRKLLIGAGVLMAALLFSAGVAAAASNDVVIRGADKTIYRAGENVTITGVVNGDIFCFGRTVTIDAEVTGDVICAGQTVTVNGVVKGDVRVAGQTVKIGAQVERNGTLAAQDASLQSNGTIGGDIGVFSQSSSIDGTIGRDIKAGSENLTINNRVGRDAEAYVTKLVLINKAAVGGNVTYESPNQLYRDRDVVVGGKVTHRELERDKQEAGSVPMWLRAYFLLAKIVIGLTFVALLPQLFRRWNDVGTAQFGWAMMAGFIAMFALPAIVLGAVMTFVGIPLALFLIVAWLAALFPSMVLSMYFVGSRIIPRQHPLLIVTVGAVVLGILEMLPYVGFLFLLAAYLYGTGALLVNLKRAYKKPKYRKQ